jgi:hypothetical protein
MYGPFSLCVIHKEGLCPSSGDINGLMMNVTLTFYLERVAMTFRIFLRDTHVFSKISKL